MGAQKGLFISLHETFYGSEGVAVESSLSSEFRKMCVCKFGVSSYCSKIPADKSLRGV